MIDRVSLTKGGLDASGYLRLLSLVGTRLIVKRARMNHIIKASRLTEAHARQSMYSENPENAASLVPYHADRTYCKYIAPSSW
jgi:hypothetical protein